MSLQSYANAVISSLEDPEKVLEQTVIEMSDDLIKMRQSTAQVRLSLSMCCLSSLKYVCYSHLFIFI